MAALQDHKTVGAPYTNDTEIIKVVYDHAVDGTMESPLDVITASKDIIIKSYWAKVITTCTSGGSATMEVGISGGDVDLLMDAVAVGNLTEGTLHAAPQVLTEGTPNTMSPQLPVKLASGGKIVCDTSTDSFTAGKIEFTFEIAKF